MKVAEFMTTNIRFIDADQSVYDAIEKMVDRRIRSLVVRFSDDPMDYGVVTARDIMLRVLSKGKNPADMKISEIASIPMLCVDIDKTMLDVAKIMEQKHVARVFVCENGKLVGVVALMDLLSAALIKRARGE